MRFLPPELGEMPIDLVLALLHLAHRPHVAVEGRLTHRIIQPQLFEPGQWRVPQGCFVWR